MPGFTPTSVFGSLFAASGIEYPELLDRLVGARARALRRRGHAQPLMRFCWRCGASLPATPPTTCTACGQAHYLNPVPCGEAVVVREGKVLLLRRAMDPYEGYWDVPGGFCDAAEHPMRAAERELAEELGLSARATTYIGAWMDVYGPPAADGVRLHCITSAYLMELEDPERRAAPAPRRRRPGSAGSISAAAGRAGLPRSRPADAGRRRGGHRGHGAAAARPHLVATPCRARSR